MIEIEQKLSLQGRYKIVATKLDGTQRVLADWFENLITTGGLNRLGTGAVASFCQVGTGSTAPTNGDTSLTSFLVGTSTIMSTTYGNMTSSPYYSFLVRTFRFGIGVAAGNLTEVGVGWASSGSLFSRSLIKDINGDPAPITIVSDEILEVQYELRIYPPEVDTTGTFNILGVDYDYTVRAASVTSNSWSYWGIVAWIDSVNGAYHNSSFGGNFYDGAIGAITTAPSGTAYNNTMSSSAYGNNNLYRDFSLAAGIDYANFGSGVGAALFNMNCGTYQIGFLPKLPKNNTKTLTVTVRTTWARKTL